MSNEEKKRLEEYRKRRAKWILIQGCIFVILSLFFVGLVFTYQTLDSTYYITYKESSYVDYKVKLKENDVYEEEYLGEDFAYVTALIDNIEATFNYNLEIDAKMVSYDFTLSADALLQIIDTSTNNVIYKSTHILVPETTQKIESNKLNLPLDLTINYEQYNDEVTNVVKTLDLKNYKANLLVAVTYNVLSECEDFSSKNNSHNLTLTVPLNQSIIKLTESKSIPTAEPKTIACERIVEKSDIALVGFVVLCCDIIVLIILISFIYLTRNTHINYAIKVKKIVNAYKSFIQKINNVFDTTGYQVLLVNTINEMLEIRDTLQSPILMNENEDKTMTKFIIPTNNKILYVYELKIENYDEIYGLNEETKEEIIEEYVEELVVPIEEVIEQNNEVEEEVKEEIITDEVTNDVTETEVEKTSENGTIDSEENVENILETEIRTVEYILEEVASEETFEDISEEPVITETVEEVLVENHSEEAIISEEDELETFEDLPLSKYRYSFEAKLILSSQRIQEYYKKIVQYVKRYGVKVTKHFKSLQIHQGKKSFATLIFSGKTLCILFPLNPQKEEFKVYDFVDMSGNQKYSATPSLMRINSDDKVEDVIQILEIIFKSNKLIDKKLKYKSPIIKSMAKEDLIKNGLIKKIK